MVIRCARPAGDGYRKYRTHPPPLPGFADVVANAWTQWPDLPIPITAPFSFTMGGLVLMFDELNVNTVVAIDSANVLPPLPGAGWITLPISGGPPTPRVGQRFIAWGSTLYMFAGADVATAVQHNDLWATDLTSLTARQGTSAWMQVALDLTAGVPPARIGYTWTPFEVGAVMYGGVSIENTPGLNPYACFISSNANLCHFHQNVWAFLPGNKGQPSPNSITGASWVQLAEVGANGGPVPAGRFEHTAGNLGDQLYIFGGVTALGLSNEMWAYNLASQTWAQVTATTPWPINGQVASGLMLGRHFYQYISAPRGSTGQNGGQLWRWAPSASSGSGAGAGPAPALHPGAVAGIVIGCLLGLANTVLLIAVAANAGALPSSCVPAWPAKSGASAGYYSSSAPTVVSGGEGGDYAPVQY